MAIEDYLALLFGGQTGTNDPARAGWSFPSPIGSAQAAEAPRPMPGYLSPESGAMPAPPPQRGGARILASLSNPEPIQAPGGGDLPVNLLGPQSGAYADLQDYSKRAQGISAGVAALQPGAGDDSTQQPAPPPIPPPSNFASNLGNSAQAAPPQPLSSPAAPPAASAAAPATSYGPLMDRILRQIDAREKSSWSDNLLRFGLAAMAAGGKPGATTLGALGEGGLSALSAQDTNRGQDLKALLSGAQASNLLSETALRQNQLAAVNNLPPIPGSGAAPASGSSASNPAPGRVSSSMAVNASLPAEARALLDTIAGPESAGKYNVRYTPSGGAQFDSYGAHPNVAEKGPEGNSTAAGRYQIVKSTWDPVAQKLGLTDFSPQSQDLAAWQIAQDAYNKKTGGDLLGALREGKLPEVQSALRDSRQWDTANLRNYRANLAQYTASGGSGGEAPASAGGGGGAPNGVMVTAPQAMAYGRALEAAGRKEEAAAWFKYADPQFNPSIVGATEVAKNRAKYAEPQFDPRIVGATEAAKSAVQFRDVRPGGYVAQGGNIVGAAPQLVEGHDPTTGAAYRFYTTAPLPGQPAQGAAGAGGAAPAMPGAPPGAIPGALGPGQTEALKVRAKEEQEQRQKVIEAGGAAQQAQSSFQNMRDSAANFTQGPFASHIQEAARYLRLVLPSWDGQVANYEDFQKNAGIVLRQVTKEVSSREAVQGMQMFERSLPSAEMSPKGFDRTTAQFMGLNDFKIIKSQAQQQWEQEHGGIGNVQNFETDFQKKLTPLPLMYLRMSESDQAALSNQLNATKEGRSLKASLDRQLEYVRQSGLGAVLQ